MRPRLVYRGLRADRYTADNFRSRQARGFPPRGPGPYYADLNRGVSVVATLDDVRTLARLLPRSLWRYAVVLEIPDNVRLAQTQWEGHYTVWADPEQFLGWARRIERL